MVPMMTFDPETSHVLAALLHKFHMVKVEGKSSVTVWGTGKPRNVKIDPEALHKG